MDALMENNTNQSIFSHRISQGCLVPEGVFSSPEIHHSMLFAISLSDNKIRHLLKSMRYFISSVSTMCLVLWNNSKRKCSR